MIDEKPGGGGGTFAALRLQPDNPFPEIWYHDFRKGAFKLDVDYCGYLDELITTKGAPGWHYLPQPSRPRAPSRLSLVLQGYRP
ncbi:hypothetical protein AB0H34_24630 [Saccharopolyspora shandongensis]|uniref:hypothetical protein n=1 Tax=Saccharopolyspora shandongensis TaxID=418495 RepID=UPI0033C28798